MQKCAFIITQTVELLDLAGPVQVFIEAQFQGFEVELEYYKYTENPISTSGLSFGNVAHFSTVNLKAGDFLFVPGMDNDYANSDSFKKEREFFDWLKECSDKKIIVCSICNGAFALGHAGLLKNTECTTHWRRLNALQTQFPQAKVLSDTLYVKSNKCWHQCRD